MTPGAVEGRGVKGAVAPVKKLWGLSPPKIICSCDGELSSIASIIQDTGVEQSRSRYSSHNILQKSSVASYVINKEFSLVGGGQPGSDLFFGLQLTATPWHHPSTP